MYQFQGISRLVIRFTPFMVTFVMVGICLLMLRGGLMKMRDGIRLILERRRAESTLS